MQERREELNVAVNELVCVLHSQFGLGGILPDNSAFDVDKTKTELEYSSNTTSLTCSFTEFTFRKPNSDERILWDLSPKTRWYLRPFASYFAEQPVATIKEINDLTLFIKTIIPMIETTKVYCRAQYAVRDDYRIWTEHMLTEVFDMLRKISVKGT